MELTIKHLTDTSRTALWHQYLGQYAPQPVSVRLSLETGEMWIEINPEIGNGTPEPVYNGREIAWSFPCVPTPEQANDFMEEIASLAQDILNGAEVAWNGNNHVGRLTDDASMAEDMIDQRIMMITSEIDEEEIDAIE